MGAVDDYVTRADQLADEDRVDEALALLEDALQQPLTARERARLATELGWKLYDNVADGPARARCHADEALRLLAGEADASDVFAVRGAAQCLLAHCLWTTDNRVGLETARLAVQTLEQAMRWPARTPWMSWLPFDAARAHLLLDEGEQGIACARRFLTAAKSDTERLNGLGLLAEALRTAGDLPEAEQVVEQALRDAQGRPRFLPLLLYTRGQILRAGGRGDEARESLERALSGLQDDPARFQATAWSLAELCYEGHDYQRAATVLQELLPHCAEDDPNRPALLSWLGACSMQLEEYEEARAPYDAVIASSGASEEERAEAAEQALWCLAATTYRRREYRTARDLFSRLLEYNPDDDGDRHRLYLWLGHCHYKLSEYGEARDCYENVLTSPWASEDEQATAVEWADWSAARLHEGLGQYAQAAARLERLAARYREDAPQHYAALLSLGDCHRALGASAAARASYQAVGASPHARDEEKAAAHAALKGLH